jgi:hypothetical protein
MVISVRSRPLLCHFNKLYYSFYYKLKAVRLTAVEADMVLRRRGFRISLDKRFKDGAVSLTSRPCFTRRRLSVLGSVRGFVDPRDIV